uniref:Uncharacterized protein n=1 Tax=Rhizophora mucronata TaxID=61149 RepID=A0A2P2J2C8_RHIMU
MTRTWAINNLKSLTSDFSFSSLHFSIANVILSKTSINGFPASESAITRP